MKGQHMKVFLISGGDDPCGSFRHDAKYLNDSYTKVGLDAKYKVYKDTRHELLNEENKEEVMQDIIDYLERSVG